MAPARDIRLLSVLLMPILAICLSSHVSAEDQTYQTSNPDDDVSRQLWITFSLTPEVSRETLDYLYANTEPQYVTWKGGESEGSFFARNYGYVPPAVQTMFWDVNRNAPAESTRDRKVIRTPGSKIDQKTILVPWNGNLDTAVYTYTGMKVGEKTLEEIKRMNPGVDLNRLESNRPIKIPAVSREGSLRIKASTVREANDFLMNLRNTDVSGKGIASSTIEQPMQLVPHWGLTATNDSNGIRCPNDKVMKNSLPLSVPLEVLNDRRYKRDVSTIAVIDSGIGTVEAPFDDRFTFWQQPQQQRRKIGENYARIGDSLADNVYRSDPAGNRFGSHGTHVAGIATGRLLAKHLPATDAQDFIDQLNSRIELMVLKVTDEERENGESVVLESALSKAIDFAGSQIAKIVNMSIVGQGYENDEHLFKTIETYPNLLFVVAAGNGDSGKNGFDIGTSKELLIPALYTKSLNHVITVGAHDGDGNLACFSNYGKDEVDLVAPGVSINSTLTGNREGTFSGTSQATPAVTFAASLLYSLGLQTPREIKHRLISSVDVTPEVRDRVWSGGKLSLEKALRFEKDLIELIDGTILEGDLALQDIKLDGEEFLVHYSELRRIDINFPEDLSTQKPNHEIHRFTVYKGRRNGDHKKLRHVFSRWGMDEVLLYQGNQTRKVPLSEIRAIITASKRCFRC